MSSRDPELHNEDIRWLIQDAESALGLRGAGVEPGNATSPEQQSEALIARLWHVAFPFGRPRNGDAAHNVVERYRRVAGVWRLVAPKQRDCLVVYYSTAGELPQGAARLKRFATVALWQAGSGGIRALRKACSGGSGKTLRDAMQRAEQSVRAAHRAVMAAEQEAAKRWLEANP